MHKGFRWHTRDEKIERFWSFVRRSENDECWIWNGRKDKNGYGVFIFEGKSYRTHRLAWILTTGGELPPALKVLHKCDNPSCINPKHLYPGTNADNMRDMVLRGRSLKGKLNPSHLHPENMPRGEQNTRSKLTEAKVRQIRKLAAKGVSNSVIGRQFGIWPNNVRFIINRQTWKHVK